jgi:hypothetical protein
VEVAVSIFYPEDGGSRLLSSTVHDVTTHNLNILMLTNFTISNLVHGGLLKKFFITYQIQ